MMIDYNISDHWSDNTPAWLKSLISSLDRRHRSSSVLPLTVIVAEIAEWVELACGTDAWQPGPNRDSLRLDLEQSASTIGPSLRRTIAAPLAAFEAAFAHLISRPRAVLGTGPGVRTDAVWVNVAAAAAALLHALATDGAAGACWDDLVGVAQDRSLDRRQYSPLADLLVEQLRCRGHQQDRVLRDLVSVVAYGRDPDDIPRGEKDTPLNERLVKAKTLIETPAKKQSIVIWLGYKGRIHQDLEAGRVSFYDAIWAVPNAEPGRFEFAYKEELWEIVQHGYAFRVATHIDEQSNVDTVVRVDLGVTVSAGARDRAMAIVDTILNVAIHREGGIRPRLAEYHVLRDGRSAESGYSAVRAETGFHDDTYGAGITTDAIGRHAPRIADALSREELPRFLAAAIESQTVADHPFSRDMALRTPSEADIKSVIPLADRVVQHIAAHAGMAPMALFDLVGERWAHARWLSDLQRAAGMCLLGAAENETLHHELSVEWHADRPKRPGILLMADRADDFLSLCRLDHERAWIARMFASVGDHTIYADLIADYKAEGLILEARRRRVRNALVHGNPAVFSVVESVRDYAEFVSGNALYLALESFVDGTDPAHALTVRTAEYTSMQAGQDAAGYWRNRVRNEGWPLPE
jgi:hypothetical protein